jgi:NADPH:quinone reductase-like Zn-dependent oxidoreductase
LPDNLRVAEVEKPTPKDNEVLIRVCAASINAADWHKMQADTFMVRMASGLFKPKYAILGGDVAGVVEAIGKNVKELKTGDEVYGCIADIGGNGSFAEYICAIETVFAPKPSGLTFEQASAVPMAAVTALQGLRNMGKIKQGQKVLINGASGGVGTFAVQISKAFGAQVTAVCSSRNIEIAYSLGADFVVDYLKADFTQTEDRYDLILDIVAKRKLSDYKRILKPDGICVCVGFTSMMKMLKVLLFGSFGNKKVVQLMADNKNKDDLIYLNKLIESGKLKPVIDNCYSLDDAPKAFRHFGEKHAKGKIIFSVAH